MFSIKEKEKERSDSLQRLSFKRKESLSWELLTSVWKSCWVTLIKLVFLSVVLLVKGGVCLCADDNQVSIQLCHRVAK